MRLNDQISSIPAEEFKILKKNIKRSDSIGKYKADALIYYPYGFVKIDLPDLLSEGNFEAIIKQMLGRRFDTCITPQKALPFVFWVFDEFKNVLKIEKEYLSSFPEPDLVNAGINRLNELGETNLIDTLAGGDITKWEEIKAIPYWKVFDKQRKMKLESDIQKDLHRIQKEKAKNKKH